MAPAKPKDEKTAFGMVHDGRCFYRAATVRASDVDIEKRTARLTFSSEAAVQRWYGTEILLHDDGAVDLGRLRTMGACLVNHNPDQIAGPVKEASIGADHRGAAVVGFDDDECGNGAMRKAHSGSLRGVSVGYLIHRAKRLQDNEEFDHPRLGRIVGPALIATRWEPIEISLTPIPADSHVGVGRDATRSLDGIEIEPFTPSAPPDKEEEAMDKRTRQYLEGRGLDSKATEDQAWEFFTKLPEEDKRIAAKPQEKPPEKPPEAAKAAISRELYGQAVAAGNVDLALRMACEGKPDAEIREALLKAMAEKRDTPAGPGKAPPDAKKLDSVSDEDLCRALAGPPAFVPA